MRFLKTRLFFTLMVVVCLGVAFMSITYAHAASVETTHPLTSQAGNTPGKMVSLNTSASGCNVVSVIVACISIDSKGIVRPDGYVTNNKTLQDVTITLYNIPHTGDLLSQTETNLHNVSGHFFGNPIPMTKGHTYLEEITATLNDGQSILVDSPMQTT